jgi:DNA-binding protein HU-beta
MYKDELLKVVAATAKHTVKDTESVFNALVGTITKTLKKGQEVKLIGFGTFKTYKRKARPGRNPSTGAAMKIPAKTVVKFTPGKTLADSVRK